MKLLAVADFGDEVGEARFDFGASEGLGALAGHGVAARSAFEFCFVDICSGRIAQGLRSEGQCSAGEFFGPGVCRFWRFHVVLPFRMRMSLGGAAMRAGYFSPCQFPFFGKAVVASGAKAPES
jgi:hypothetical protein